MSVSCPKTNIELCPIKRGDTWNGFKFEITDDQSTPIDVSDVAEVHIQFKRNKLDNTATLDYKLSLGEIILVGTEFRMTPVLLNIPVGLYFFDVQITYTNGDISTIFGGSINVIQDVTR